MKLNILKKTIYQNGSIYNKKRLFQKFFILITIIFDRKFLNIQILIFFYKILYFSHLNLEIGKLNRI